MGVDKNPSIDILLATYNGGPYLGDLLRSLKAQTYANWTLLVRDDGSDDNTLDVLNDFVDKRVRLIKDEKRRLGARGSFSELLRYSTADYIMFCDQDDVWLPEKLDLTMKKMLEAEAAHKGRPIMVHTDMVVADKDLNVLSRSFWDYQHIDPELTSLNSLLTLNVATGCTMMINRNLKELAPIPEAALIHDWWMALVASAFGRIERVDAATVLYRQHGKNAAGALKYPFGYIAARIRGLEGSKELLKGAVAQGGSFYSAYGERLSGKDRLMVRDFSSLLKMGRLQRARTLLKHRFSCSGFLRNLGMFTLFVSLKPVKK
jgi:glycosyltransferase involved in cell wall biosynthesis